MAHKQKNRAPKLNTAQHMYQGETSPVMPEAISLHTEDQAAQEQQSYAMVTGLLQILVHMQSPRIKRALANLFIRHVGGQHCLPTVRRVCCSFLQPVS